VPGDEVTAMSVSVIVLAAGAGTRMRSERPKPLHQICGRPMVLHVIHALELLAPERTAAVVGHGAEQVTKKVQETAPAWANVTFVEQTEQRGTGDATAIGMTALAGDDYDDDAIVVVVPGDTPLLRADTLDELVAAHVANANAATLLTSVLDDPAGYGRVVRAQEGACCGSSSSATRRPTSSRSRSGTPGSWRSGATCSDLHCATSRPTMPKVSCT